MTDRIPGAPGQYKATVTAAELEKMQAGEAFTITMTRDDQPIVAGTPYNKASVLPDDLAALICPGVSDPSPADALAALRSAITKLFVANITTGSADDLKIPFTLLDIRTNNDELYNMFATGGTKSENYAFIITFFLNNTNADASKLQIAFGYTHAYMATRAFYNSNGWKRWNMQMSGVLHPYFTGDTRPSNPDTNQIFFRNP